MAAITAFLMILLSSPFAGQTSVGGLITQARTEMNARHYKNAADLYREVLKQDPGRQEAVYGLVQALLRDHKSKDAYTAAADGLEANPNASPIQAAAGMVAFRRGQLSEAESYFRKALQLNPNDPGALSGLARVYTVVSRFKTSRDLRLRAYGVTPTDSGLMLDHAYTLKGEARIQALEQVLAMYDPATPEAQSLRASIAMLRALGDKTSQRLASPYAAVQLKSMTIQNGVTHKRGIGLRVQLNGKETITLVLDTGSSGISVSPSAIVKAGLMPLGDEATKVKGVGDKEVSGREYLASSVRIGSVEFENYPVSVFSTAKDSDVDGLIGPDVFRDFIVSIDFVYGQISLAVRPDYQPGKSEGLTEASGQPAPGFYRFYRFGDHIVIPTSVNGGTASLFLLDSGASTNLIDTNFARGTTNVSRDQLTTVRGVQGKLNDVSRAGTVNLHFANFLQENSQMVAIDMERLSDDMGVAIEGVLGMPILSQLKITIDYIDGSIRFEHPK